MRLRDKYEITEAIIFFRVKQIEIESWKLYTETTGGGRGMLWTATDEYTDNHKMPVD